MRRLTMTLTIALAAALLTAPATADPAPAPARPIQVPQAALERLPESHALHAPVLLEGTTDRLSASAQVVAQAWPTADVEKAMKPGATFTALPVARAAADASGHYQLRVDPTLLPAGYVGKDGTLDLTVTAWDGSHVGEATTSVRFSKARARFVAPGVSEARAETASVSSAALAAPTLALPATTRQVSAPTGLLTKPWVECKSALVQRGKKAWATVAEGLPAKGQSTSFKFTKKQTVTLGVAMDVSNDKVGYRASGTVSRTDSFEITFAKSSVKRYYQVQTEQGQYRSKCYAVTGGSSTYLYTKWEWRTLGFTGGGRVVAAKIFPSWAHCVKVPKGTWTRSRSDGSAYSNSVGLQLSGIAGIDVSTSSQYDATDAVTYHQPNGKYQLCGSNNFPASASRIRGKAA